MDCNSCGVDLFVAELSGEDPQLGGFSDQRFCLRFYAYSRKLNSLMRLNITSGWGKNTTFGTQAKSGWLNIKFIWSIDLNKL